MGQDAQEVWPAKRDAAFGWSEAWPRDMQKDGAATAANAWAEIAVEHDNGVVQTVGPPHPFGGCGIGVADATIVIAIVGGIAPAIGR